MLYAIVRVQLYIIFRFQRLSHNVLSFDAIKLQVFCFFFHFFTESKQTGNDAK